MKTINTINVQSDEVPAWKQKGTERPTAFERRARWHESRRECVEIRSQTIATFSAISGTSRPSAPIVRIALAPKDTTRTERRACVVMDRFSRLPKFLRTPSLDVTYQVLRNRVLALLSNTEARQTNIASKLVRQMVDVHEAEQRSLRFQSTKNRIPYSVSDEAWCLDASFGVHEFSALLSAAVVRSTVILWMSPRSEVTALGRVRAKLKLALDKALRLENSQRRKEHLPEVKDRDALVLAGYRGAHWRQIAVNKAKETLCLCEMYLKHFRYRGELSLIEYRQAFGLNAVKTRDLQGLGPRHFVAAQVLIAGSAVDEKVSATA